MKKIWVSFISLGVRFPVFSIIVSLLVAAPFILQASHAHNSDNTDNFTLQNDEDALFFKEFKRVFSNSDFFLIALELPDLFSQEKLNVLKKITSEIESIPEVKKVRSIINVDYINGSDDSFEVRKFFKTIPANNSELKSKLNIAVNNILYRGTFISPDGKTAGIVVWCYDHPEGVDYNTRIISKTENKIIRKRPA